MSDFVQKLLKDLEALFDEGELETLLFIANDNEPFRNSAVKIIHKPTGEESVCDEFESQIRNKAAALVSLVGKLKRRISI